MECAGGVACLFQVSAAGLRLAVWSAGDHGRRFGLPHPDAVGASGLDRKLQMIEIRGQSRYIKRAQPVGGDGVIDLEDRLDDLRFFQHAAFSRGGDC